LTLLDFETERVDCGSDIGIRDRTEKASVDTGLTRNLDRLAVELLSDRLRGGNTVGLGFLEFGTTRLEFSDCGLRGTLRMTLRNQKVAREAVFDLNDLTEFTEMVDLFEKNNLHDYRVPWLSV